MCILWLCLRQCMCGRLMYTPLLCSRLPWWFAIRSIMAVIGHIVLMGMAPQSALVITDISADLLASLNKGLGFIAKAFFSWEFDQLPEIESTAHVLSRLSP